MAIFFNLELRDFGRCLAWPRVAMACPARSAKSIRGDGRGKEEGRTWEGKERDREACLELALRGEKLFLTTEM